jgi:hypothetical protein
MKVSWDDEIHNTWKYKNHVPNPPTRYGALGEIYVG